MRIPNNIYDILKWVITVVLPAISALYAAISEIWGLPYGTQITGTISAIAACGAAVLGVQSIRYAKEKAKANEAQSK